MKKVFLNEEAFEKLNEDLSNEEAKEIIDGIVEKNLGLVNHMIKKRYPNLNSFCQLQKILPDDLFSAGVFGLWKAVLTFKTESKVKFVTYAATVINNEFGMFVRNNNKHYQVFSYDTIIQFDNDEHATFKELVKDENADEDIINFIEEEYNNSFIDKFLNSLDKRDREIIELHFYNNLSQSEISEIIGISQSYISRLLKAIIKKGKKLYRREEIML